MAFLGPLIGAGMNFLGGVLGNNAANNQRGQALGYAYNNALPYLQGMGIPNPQQYLNPAFNGMNTFGNQVIGNMGQWLPDFLAQNRQDLIDFRGQIPGLMNPGDMGSFYNSPWADVGRTYDGLTQNVMGQLPGILSGYGGMNDILMSYLGGQNGPLSTLQGVGSNLLDMRGNTGYNMNATDAAGRAISGGGWDPRFSGLYDAGNSLFSSGGMTPGLGGAYSTALQGINNYGMTPGLSGLSNYALGGLQGGALTPGMQALTQMSLGALPAYLQGPASQGGQFGQAGNAAISRLLGGNGMAPSLPNGVSPQNFQSALAQIQGLGRDGGYTAQNLGMGMQGSQGLQNLLGREGDINDLINTAHQAFTGKLPGGASADDFGNLIQQYMGQLAGGGGGVSAGMASGASAGGLIPMDPTLEGMLKQGAEYFKNNPLLSMDQMVSMARDAAATAAAQKAEAAQRFALARGGGGAVINAGQQNQAMADFHEQALQAEAQAVREAMLKRQELGLQQQMQGAQIGLGASQADTQRQQVAASRDIASANNATSASIASANNATQASSANAQLRSAALQAAMNAAVQARGQEYGQSQAGLSALAQAQQIANQRGSIFEDAAKAGMSDATARYVANLGTLNNIPGILNANANNLQALGQYQNQFDANRNNALGSVLSGALQGSGQALTGNNNMAQILANLGISAQGLGNNREQGLLGAGNTANATASNNLGNFLQLLQGTNSIGSNNLGMGMNAMQGAGGLANNALSIFGNIGNQASADQIARMTLGGNLLGQNLNATQGFGSLLNNGMNGMYGAFGNMAGLGGNLLGQQAGIWQNMFGQDFNNRQLGGNLYNSYFGNQLGLGGLGNSYAQTGLNPLNNIFNGMTQYASSSLNPYASIIGGTFGMQNYQQNPWPQVQIPSNMFGGYGGFKTPPFNGGSSGGSASGWGW